MAKIEVSDELLDLAEQLQKERWTHVKKCSRQKEFKGSYQDAVNTWIDLKLADLILKNKLKA